MTRQAAQLPSATTATFALVTGTGAPSGEDLLVALADARSHGLNGMSARGLAEATGRDRKLVARVVDDLHELGFVEIEPASRAISLGWGLRALAAQVADQRLVVRGQSVVDRLAAQSRESAYLVIRRGSLSVTLAEAMPDLGVRGMSWVGRSQPVVRGDAGPVLLMDLTSEDLATVIGPEPLPHCSARRAPRSAKGVERLVTQARLRGFCVLEGLVEDDVTSVGAPVYDFRARLVGALVIVGPTPRVTGQLVRATDLVVKAAGTLTHALGGTPWTARPEQNRGGRS